MILFANLGAPALFEPDEGRNAEKAREILLLNDWVTPHENFLPVLDKPMFFYWLIAISYQLFGVSEWSARLPSALAALGCLFLVYRFTRAYWGASAASWSTLVLLTGLEFYLLARIVIFDMTLTFLTTLALFSFYAAAHADNDATRKIQCLLMYSALGAGTLVKGLAGVVIPGMIFFFYLLLTRNWRLLGRLYLLPGALLYLASVLPWYLWAEARNPGYLRYFFWDEHFTRYLTSEFNRSESWYYFIFVVAIGFLPWTVALPWVAKKLWNKPDDKTLFLLLWVTLPLVFFSASDSKLPHYILPIFPALAMLTGQALGAVFHDDEAKKRSDWIFYLPWAVTAGFLGYLVIGSVWPNILAREIRPAIVGYSLLVGLCALSLLITYGAYAVANVKGYRTGQSAVYLCSILGMAIFLLLVGEIQKGVSIRRSPKNLGMTAAPFISRDSQVVIYDTYLTGMLFYLKLDRPMWIVRQHGRSSVMTNSPRVSKMLPRSTPRHGKIVLTFEEFSEAWKETRRPLLVFLKARHLSRFADLVGADPMELAQGDEFVLVTKE